MVVRDRGKGVDCLIYKVSFMVTRMFWNKIGQWLPHTIETQMPWNC